MKPASGHLKQLVILLHGYGADGNDLISLGNVWRQSLPDAEFLSPHAPFPCDGSPFGKQWFSIGDLSESYLLKGVKEAAPILNDFIDHALEERGLDDSNLALVGFSQGTMMALHVATHRTQPCAGVVGYSGVYVENDTLPVTAHPEILLVHGEQDMVVPVECLDQSRDRLTKYNINVEAHRRPDLDHGIDEIGLNLGESFLKKHLM